MIAAGRRERGAVLAGVLCIAAAVLALTAGWFEASVAQLRRAGGFAERIRAFHAADAALDACAVILPAHLPVPPDCTIDALDDAGVPGAQGYLVTAHARGGQGAPPIWLQQQIVVASGTVVERRWRELAGQPR